MVANVHDQASGSPKLLCDNLGAIHLNFNLVEYSQMKYIQIDLHFDGDMVQCGILNVYHINRQDQLVDLLTTALSFQRTETLRIKIKQRLIDKNQGQIPSQFPFINSNKF